MPCWGRSQTNVSCVHRRLQHRLIDDLSRRNCARVQKRPPEEASTHIWTFHSARDSDNHYPVAHRPTKHKITEVSMMCRKTDTLGWLIQARLSAGLSGSRKKLRYVGVKTCVEAQDNLAPAFLPSSPGPTGCALGTI